MITEAEILEQINPRLAGALEEIGAHVASEVFDAAPSGKTQNLAASTTYSVDPTAKAVSIRVDAFYAFYIEFGFRHRIGKKSILKSRKWGTTRLGYTKLSREQIAAGEFKQIAPNPFIRSTVYGNIGWITDTLNKALNR